MNLLASAETIYRALYQRRREKFSRNPVDVGVPIISVGNLTLGGTGKTPCVQWVARQILQDRYRVAVVSRGYGGTLSSAGAIVSDGTKVLLSAQEAGDEPLLHARALPGVPVIIGVDRVRAARRAIEECGAEIVVLDDGFQFWSLQRDLDIVLLDAWRPFDNEHLLPAGRLREPPTALERAAAIILTRCNTATPSEIIETCRTIANLSSAPIFQSNHALSGVRNETTNEVLSLDVLKGTPVAALSALANNEQFFQTLQRTGANVVAKLAKRDHHRWSEAEVSNFAHMAQSNGATALITTEKDAVKIEAAWAMPLPLQSLIISLDLGDDAPALAALLRLEKNND